MKHFGSKGLVPLSEHWKTTSVFPPSVSDAHLKPAVFPQKVEFPGNSFILNTKCLSGQPLSHLLFKTCT